jgi:hypothetical protein
VRDGLGYKRSLVSYLEEERTRRRQRAGETDSQTVSEVMI